MKKKDKAALMKIVIGGLVLVGLYFGWQAMSGDSSPFSMASRSPYINVKKVKKGSPFHGEILRKTIRRIPMGVGNACSWFNVATWSGIVKTEEKAVHVQQVNFRIAVPLRNNVWGSGEPGYITPNIDYGLFNPKLQDGDGNIISKSWQIISHHGDQKWLRFYVRGNHVIAANTEEEWQVYLSVQTRPLGTKKLRLDLASEFKGVTVLTDGVGGVPKNITSMGNTAANGKIKTFTCLERAPVVASCTNPAEIRVSVYTPQIVGVIPRERMSELALGRNNVIRMRFSSSSRLPNVVKLGKIELNLKTSRGVVLGQDSIEVRKDNRLIPLRSHSRPARHPAGSLRSATATTTSDGTDWEGIISFETPIFIGTSTMLDVSVKVTGMSATGTIPTLVYAPASITTNLKHDESVLNTRSDRDNIENPESNSFAWWSCNNDSNKEWKNGFNLDGNAVMTLPSETVIIKNY